MQSEIDKKNPVIRGSRRYWRWSVEIILLVTLFFALHAYQTRDLVRGPAPAFKARLIDGEWVNLEGYRGRPLLLHFWASWCPVCRLQQGSIDSIAQDQQVLTVTLDDMSGPALQRWMRQQGVSFPVIQDQAAEIAAQYGVHAVPSSIIIDAAGQIRFTEAGFTTETGLRLRLWWAGL
jgi:peroxiredoxin